MYVRDLLKIIDTNKTKVFISKDDGETFDRCFSFDRTQLFLKVLDKIEICSEDKIRVYVEPIPDYIYLRSGMEFRLRPCPLSVFDRILGVETTCDGDRVVILVDSDYMTYAVKESTMTYIMENCGCKLENGKYAMSFTREKVRGCDPYEDIQGKPRDFWGNVSL